MIGWLEAVQYAREHNMDRQIYLVLLTVEYSTLRYCIHTKEVPYTTEC